MSRFGCHTSLIVFVAFIAFTLTPVSVFAQHGGGGGHAGGGGGFHGGGGGFHGGGGGYHGGGVGGGSVRGGSEGVRGGFSGGGRSFGGGSGGSSRQGGVGAGRNGASSGSHSSNLPSAINDGQWHSFANSGASSRLSQGRGPGSAANSNLVARNNGSTESGWHSFGSPSSQRGTAGAGVSRGGPNLNWRGGWGGYGWRGYGWHGGWGGYGWGWGPGWGFGWNWGLGFGWPYWGGYWGLGWNPWGYGPYGNNPYWYAPLNYDYDSSINWDDNPPPYRLGMPSNQEAATNDSPAVSLNVSSPSSDTP